MRLTTGEHKRQRVAQSIDINVDLGAEPASTAAKCLCLLTTVFLWRQPHMDELGLSCCLSTTIPYPDHRQNARASDPRHHGHTSERTACKHCSSCRASLATGATAHRFATPRKRLRQIADSRLLDPHRLVARYAERRRSWATDQLVA